MPRLAQRLDRLLALWDRGGAHDLDIEAALLEGLAGADHDLIRAYAERPLSGVLIIASNSAELRPDIVDGRITKYLFPCERPQAHASSLVVRVRRSRERLGGVIDPFPPSDGSPSEIGEHHQRNQYSRPIIQTGIPITPISGNSCLRKVSPTRDGFGRRPAESRKTSD